ncbi:MAG: hypothetical protein ACFBSG_16455 [Leptolyngbyaceae cyanobacterium]
MCSLDSETWHSVVGSRLPIGGESLQQRVKFWPWQLRRIERELNVQRWKPRRCANAATKVAD